MLYSRPWWLPDAHSQTIAAARLAGKPGVEYHRVRWDSPDHDFIDLDFTEPVDQHHRFDTLWVLFHGLEGSSESHYCLAMMSRAKQEGALGVVVHFRGCSGELNWQPRAYHSGDSAELDWVLPRLRKELPNVTDMHVTGVSLGGNVLLKWLGEQGQNAAKWVTSAVAVSAPVNLKAGAVSLAKGFNMLYTRMFLSTLIPKAIKKIKQYPDLGNDSHIAACRNFFEFDDRVTAPWHGFDSALDYYAKSSALYFLGGISVPTLLLHALNDPFMPGQYLPEPMTLPSQVRCLYTREGGHVGFATGQGARLQLGWLPRTCSRFFDDPEQFDGR